MGIGASAGGLKALEQFFANVPPDTDLAYVVVQHTRAKHTTLLGTLLQRVTRLPVHDATNGVVLAPNTVYVMPTGGQLRVLRGCLHFQAAQKPHPAPAAIDVFFTSLAQDQAQAAVGVVLSGMGHDGTRGLQAIHSAGGWCLAQQPDTADFADMPQSAIDAACVDAVAPAQDMPGLIVQWSKSRPQVEPPAAAQSSDADVLQQIVQWLHQHLQHDFSLYKPSTLLRRIERRMHVHHLPTLTDYLQYLRVNPAELDVLFSEMLIGVTSFFRDPPMWLDLSCHVLPGLLNPPRTSPIRAWVLGCSTGEEAYSLAMALREAQDLYAAGPVAVQIYATDLNPNAIAVARKGWYAAPALAHVSAQRRERFFIPHEGGFSIHPDIRAMVMFARHDVITDPPFTRLDLLLCRNVLIYFNATLQQRLMPLFHFSLRAGGTLVLGSAETIGRAQHLFTSRVPGSRIYARTAQAVTPGSVVFPVQHNQAARPLSQEPALPQNTSAPPQNLQTLADQVLLEHFSPAAVLVNATGDILYTRGRTGQYLEPAAGKANWNIHVMVRPMLRTQIGMALSQALQAGLPVAIQSMTLGADRQRQLQVTVHPLLAPPALAGMAMVVFSESAASAALPSQSEPTETLLNAELQSAHAQLQALRQEMQASKDQMVALHESMKLSNEELQSANEELTTAKEEAQSMNEELQTINNELQTRLDDLALAQSDMQNLLNSTDIATLFLDNELNVRRYTEQAVPIFHLREADVGRPLSDLANTLDYPDLLDDVQATLRTLSPCTKSVASSDGHWFSVRIMPYRTLANMVNGAVLTFVDISAAKALEFRLREAH